MITSVEMIAWVQFFVTLAGFGGVIYVLLRIQAYNKAIKDIGTDVERTARETVRMKGMLATIKDQTDGQLSALQLRLDETENRLLQALMVASKAKSDLESAEDREARLSQPEAP